MKLLHATRRALGALMLGLPLASQAIAPAPAGQLTLPAPLLQLRSATQAPRLLALLQAQGARPGGLQVLDIAQPGTPAPRGFLPLGSGTVTQATLALSPDGQRALLLQRMEPPGGNAAALHRLLALDLGDAAAPRELWRRELRARTVLLAPDASAWAASMPVDGKSGQWASTVQWLGDTRPTVTLMEKDGPPAQLSLQGNYLAYAQNGHALQVADLRAPGTALQMQAYSGYARHACTVAVLDNGHVLVEDARAARMGLYAPGAGMPRVARLPHDGTRHCAAIGFDTVAGNVLMAGAAGVVRRVNLSQPAQPIFNGEWQLPPGATPMAAAGAYLYAGDGASLRMFRMDLGNASDVDWAALDKAHAAAMARRAQALLAGRKDADDVALAELERAGAAMAPDSPLLGIAPRRAAAILGDYGQLLAPQTSRSALAEFALKRAVVLDPGNQSAVLNLADYWREHLPQLTDLAKREHRHDEVAALYRSVVQAGGKPEPRMLPYLSMDGSAGHAAATDADFCDAVARHTNAGLLRERVSDVALNVALGSRRVDLVFDTEGTAHVPAVYGFDAVTDEPLDDKDIPAPGGDSLWGGDFLGLVASGGMAQVLHYRDMHHPVETAALTGGSACKFAVKVAQSVGPKASEPALCRSLMAGEAIAAIAFDEPVQASAAELLAKRHTESAATGAARVDFANNGVRARVAHMQLSSGAGAGCEAEFFELLDPAGKRPASGPQRELLMKLQDFRNQTRFPVRCGNKPRLLRHAGKTYFENQPSTTTALSDYSQYHRVTRVSGGAVREVCDFHFESSVSVLR